MSGCFVKIESEEAPWSSGKEFEGGNMGHRAPVKGGYFPVPPVDSLQDIRNAMCLALEAAGRRGRSASPRSGGRRPDAKSAPSSSTLVKRADWMQILKYTVQNVAALLRQDRDLHAQADRRRQRLRHARAPVDLEGRQEPVRRQRLCRPVRIRAVLHRRHHQARQGAERDHQPRHQLLQAPGARLRGADQPGLLGAQPLGFLPHSATSTAPRRAASKCASRTRRPTRIWPSPR